NGSTLISEFTSLGCYDDPFRTNPKIFSLTGVEQLTALQDISLYTQGFTNISPFAALPNLQSLSLWRGSDSRQIADLSPLSMMTGLTHLSLSYQETSDLAAIGPLTALVYLKIIDAQLVDISAISTHTAMVNLDLRNNMIVDVSGLHNMVNADSINLSGNNGISCSALDALVGALGDSVVTRPWSCVTD
ncbi:MAG: hypothetical protein HRT35_38595, partial [Algicola sp.]|nr:hypothetical protein [Algicola sp.]